MVKECESVTYKDNEQNIPRTILKNFAIAVKILFAL